MLETRRYKPVLRAQIIMFYLSGLSQIRSVVSRRFGNVLLIGFCIYLVYESIIQNMAFPKKTKRIKLQATSKNLTKISGR